MNRLFRPLNNCPSLPLWWTTKSVNGYPQNTQPQHFTRKWVGNRTELFTMAWSLSLRRPSLWLISVLGLRSKTDISPQLCNKSRAITTIASSSTTTRTLRILTRPCGYSKLGSKTLPFPSCMTMTEWNLFWRLAWFTAIAGISKCGQSLCTTWGGLRTRASR